MENVPFESTYQYRQLQKELKRKEMDKFRIACPKGAYFIEKKLNAKVEDFIDDDKREDYWECEVSFESGVRGKLKLPIDWSPIRIMQFVESMENTV